MRAFAAACLLAGLAPCTAAAQGGKALTAAAASMSASPPGPVPGHAGGVRSV